MTVRVRRQINNTLGQPISGASINAYRSGETTVRSTATTDSNGYFQLDLADTHTYDLEVIFSGNKWWIRGGDAGQLARLDITQIFRLPRYTTTTRDALGLTASDAGTQIYNATTTQVEVWGGLAWFGAKPFDIHDDISTEMTAPDGADRLAISDESALGDPMHWLSLTRLRTWLEGALSLGGARITSGNIHADRVSWYGTQAEYDAITMYDDDRYYDIHE